MTVFTRRLGISCLSLVYCVFVFPKIAFSQTSTPAPMPTWSETTQIISEKFRDYGPHPNTYLHTGQYTRFGKYQNRRNQTITFNDQRALVLEFDREFVGYYCEDNETGCRVRDMPRGVTTDHRRVIAPLNNLNISNASESESWAEISDGGDRVKTLFRGLNTGDLNQTIELSCQDGTNCITQEITNVHCDVSGSHFNCYAPEVKQLSNVSLWVSAAPTDQPDRIVRALRHATKLAKDVAPIKQERF